MRTRAQAAKDRRELLRDIERQHRREAREKIRSLRTEIRTTRERRKTALREAKERCRSDRLSTRQRIKDRRAALLLELRTLGQEERRRARETCAAQLLDARLISNQISQARAAHKAEREYQAELRRIERANKKRRAEALRTTAAERRGESDDEVRANIAPELVPLFDKVGRSIRGSERKSRTEAFLHYVEQHPEELLLALDDRTEQTIRELEARERATRVELRRGPRRRRYTPEELAETPF